MTIDTKYEIGQELWHVCEVFRDTIGFWRWAVDGMPKGYLTYFIYYGQGVKYAYMGETGLDGWYNEDDLFPTREEARDECKRRNGVEP